MSRPRFWVYLAGPFVIGSLVAHPEAYLTEWFWLLLLYFLVPANVLLYGVNDYFDADTDVRNEKKSGSREFLFSGESWVLWAWISSLVLGGLAAILLGVVGWWMALFLVLAVSYSAPPLRFKARPVLDSLSNVLYVVPGFLGYALFAGSLPAWWAVVASWAWVSAMHLYSAVPDIRADQAAGLRTTAVVLGADASLMLCSVWWLLAVVAGSLSGWLVVASFLVYPVLALFLVCRSRRVVARVYWWFPLLNAFMGFLLFVQAVA